jgi:L-threonylcarbamoyladenylate synthase
MLEGGVVAFPTDTIYGLGASAYSRPGLDRLTQLKGAQRSAFIVLLADETWLDGLAIAVTPLARRLMRRHWPGPLTLVLDAAPGLAEGIRSREGTVAARVPGSEFCVSLCRALDAPVASTSANRTGEAPASEAQEIAKAFGGSVDLVIDGGPAANELPSTLIDARGDRPVLLRRGAVDIDET